MFDMCGGNLQTKLPQYWNVLDKNWSTANGLIITCNRSRWWHTLATYIHRVPTVVPRCAYKTQNTAKESLITCKNRGAEKHWQYIYRMLSVAHQSERGCAFMCHAMPPQLHCIRRMQNMKRYRGIVRWLHVVPRVCFPSFGFEPAVICGLHHKSDKMSTYYTQAANPAKTRISDRSLCRVDADMYDASFNYKQSALPLVWNE